MKKHLRIFLHKQHKNAYCDIVALQAAEMNGDFSQTTAQDFHNMIERNLKETGRGIKDGIESTFDDVGNRILIDVKQDNGKWATGLMLEQIEIMELKPTPNEEY